ncbi:thermonuclease family protein [Brachybacterium sp. 107]|uniref:thermonuclease family protein n=1 Tax=Brachybacterium sp. 107 TaxID=3457736 RepID=UPI0040339862
MSVGQGVPGQVGPRRSRPWGKAAVGLAAMGLLAGGAYAMTTGDDRRGEVVRVIDGDTLIALVDGEETTIRLLNIDTPETKDPDEEVQCLGPESAEFLVERLPAGTEIELEYDRERTDRYDRTLAGVYESGALINAEIAAEGLGVPVLFEPNDRFLPEVEEASRAAQEAGLGLFSAEIACSLPAQVQALDNAAGQIPLTVDGDPADALAGATSLVEELDAFRTALGPDGLPGLGNAVMAVPAMETFLSTLSIEADGAREHAETARMTLDDAKSDFDAEQERIEREEQERLEREEQERLDREAHEEQERLDREEQDRQDREEQDRKDRESEKSAPAPSAPPKTGGSSGGSGNGSSSGGGSTSQQTKKPAPAPESEKPKSSSGCTPYGPEISNAADGGYTGLRYGMPGGKTFRKCS